MDWQLFAVSFGGGLACGVIVLYQQTRHKAERDKLATKIDDLETEVGKLSAKVEQQSVLIERLAARSDTRPSINLTAHGDANIAGDVAGRDKTQ